LPPMVHRAAEIWQRMACRIPSRGIGGEQVLPAFGGHRRTLDYRIEFGGLVRERERESERREGEEGRRPIQGIGEKKWPQRIHKPPSLWMARNPNGVKQTKGEEGS
jgi:hypothetical protein